MKLTLITATVLAASSLLSLPLVAQAQSGPSASGSVPPASAPVAATTPAPTANPVEVAGVKYEGNAEVAGQRLVLNGAGIRYKAIFKVYTAGLYLTGRASTPEAVLANAGPKRLHIQMLRDIDGEELGKLFTKGMEQNATPAEFASAINGVLRMAEIFTQKKKLANGENFGVDYIPGTGTVVFVNGKQMPGEPIKEAAFFNLLLKIWLGKSPADNGLKTALLGGK